MAGGGTRAWHGKGSPATFGALSHSYIWQHIEVGYVQGMCDLLAPLLVILDDGEWVALLCCPQIFVGGSAGLVVALCRVLCCGAAGGRIPFVLHAV